MKAEIINVGTELLLGDILNTNARYLSLELSKLGFDLYYHITVGDNRLRLREVLTNSLNRSELIILTGGLGPTDDDLTKEVVAEILNLPLLLNENELTKIKNLFNNRGIKMTENNVKQALIPQGSIILQNDNGTAPGILIKINGKNIAILPGPPKELSLMFEKYLVPHLNKLTSNIIKSRTIKTIGIGESQLETLIKDFINNQTNPTIATYAKDGQVDIRLTSKTKLLNDAIHLLDNMQNQLEPLIKEYIYGYDNDTIEEVVFRLLKEKGLKLAFCESCTGGLITSRFTKISGASQVLDRGIITYSNSSKIEELDVNPKTIDNFGAVSPETALEMAKGLLLKSRVDIVLSVTGIAGPTGGTDSKPVGLVYIGIATNNKCYTLKYNLFGDREAIQNRTANIAFNEIRKYLESTNYYLTMHQK